VPSFVKVVQPPANWRDQRVSKTRPANHQLRVCPKPSPANWPVRVCPKIRVCPKMGPPTGQFGGVQNLAWEGPRPPPPRPQGHLASLLDQTAPHPRRILRTGERPGRQNPPRPGRRPPKSPAPTGESPRRRDAGPVGPARPPPPSKRPALPGPLMGRY